MITVWIIRKTRTAASPAIIGAYLSEEMARFRAGRAVSDDGMVWLEMVNAYEDTADDRAADEQPTSGAQRAG